MRLSQTCNRTLPAKRAYKALQRGSGKDNYCPLDYKGLHGVPRWFGGGQAAVPQNLKISRPTGTGLGCRLCSSVRRDPFKMLSLSFKVCGLSDLVSCSTHDGWGSGLGVEV